MYIKCTSSARIWRLLAYVAFVFRGSLLSLQKGGFPRLLISVVVKSWEANGWALADKWIQSSLLVDI